MTEAQQFAFASLTRGDLFPWATIRDAARVKFGFHTLGGRYLERRFRGRRGQLPGIQRTWHQGASRLGCRVPGRHSARGFKSHLWAAIRLSAFRLRRCGREHQKYRVGALSCGAGRRGSNGLTRAQAGLRVQANATARLRCSSPKAVIIHPYMNPPFRFRGMLPGRSRTLLFRNAEERVEGNTGARNTIVLPECLSESRVP